MIKPNIKEMIEVDIETLNNAIGIRKGSQELFNKITAKKEDQEIIYSVVINTDNVLTADEIHAVLKDNPSILSIPSSAQTSARFEKLFLTTVTLSENSESLAVAAAIASSS